MDLTLFSALMEMSFGPEMESVCAPERPRPKIRISALLPRATAPPIFEAEAVEAPGEFTPSISTLNAEAVFGTTMSVPLVVCAAATVIVVGVARLPPDEPGDGAGDGVGVDGAVLVCLLGPLPQPIQKEERRRTAMNRMRILKGLLSRAYEKMPSRSAVLYKRSG